MVSVQTRRLGHARPWREITHSRQVLSDFDAMSFFYIALCIDPSQRSFTTRHFCAKTDIHQSIMKPSRKQETRNRISIASSSQTKSFLSLYQTHSPNLSLLPYHKCIILKSDLPILNKPIRRSGKVNKIEILLSR